MRNSVKKYLSEKFNRDVVIEIPKERSFGHFATPIAFSLAKELKKSPIIIAENLVKEFVNHSFFAKVEALKGYLNFTLSSDFLSSHANESLIAGENFGRNREKTEKILLEFVSANPTGPLHIGHARGAIYGDTLLKIGRHLGYKIDSEYYINDAGRQINLLGLSIFVIGNIEVLGREMKLPEEFYRGDYIIDLAREALLKFGESIFNDLNHDENISKLSHWGKDEMLIVIKNNLKAVDIEFDKYISEAELYSDWNRSLEKLKNNNGVYESNGKLLLKSTNGGDDHDRVIVRENGIPTYLAGDIIYHNFKFERDYDKYINIWGADHHGYISRVKSAIDFLGYDSSKLEVLLTQMVSILKDGQPYKMSKRRGNFVLMNDVVDEVGSDPLRFIFASKTPDTSLQFDLNDLMVEDSSNPVYYINYAHARIDSLINKSSFSKSEIRQANLNNISDENRDLLFQALRLPDILEDSFNSRQTQKLADYLKNLASNYHSFYNSSIIIGSNYEKELLKLSLVVANTIRVGLKILGIEAKYRM